MDKLFGFQYVQGYTAALQDVLRTFEELQYDMKLHKRKQNYKNYKAVVECMLKNRVILREEPDAFVRCNDQADGGYEVYIQNKGAYEPEGDN